MARVKRKGILWTAEDVANYLGISISIVNKFMEEGYIHSFNVGSEKIKRTLQFEVDLFIKNVLLKKNGNKRIN